VHFNPNPEPPALPLSNPLAPQVQRQPAHNERQVEGVAQPFKKICRDFGCSRGKSINLELHIVYQRGVDWGSK